ncbi:MAG TPA: ABC transporter ATP-binding protein [Polyangiaceae bacterium]|nr:ABC transporter ATP-binding protein [Polyangiaceae bacterium]
MSPAPGGEEPAASAWPASRLGEALQALASASGLGPRGVPAPSAAGASLSDPAALGAWIEQAASYLGVEAEPVRATYGEAPAMLAGAGPALMRLPGVGPPRFLALLTGPRRRVALLRPDGSFGRMDAEALADLLCGELGDKARPEVERTLDLVGARGRRREVLGRALLREWLGAVPLGNVWTLRLPPGASPLQQAAEAGLPRRALAVVAARLATTALLGLAWWTIGQGLLEGRLDRGWLLAWALLTLTAIPASLWGSWSAGLFALDAGAWLKRRLLAGALSLEPEEVRHEGAGGFLGRVIESGAVESLALGAGLAGVASAISFALACVLLARGAGGALHLALLAAWATLGVALVGRFYRRQRAWTDARLALTSDLVERMAGHRTRLAQQPPERWHEGEDEALALYITRGEALDRGFVVLGSIVPRGWTLLGVLGLAPAFVTGAASPGAVALSLGGVLLAGDALQGLVGGLASLSAAAIAWRRVAPLFRAVSREAPAPPPSPALAAPAASPAAAGGPPPRRDLMEARELVFRHGERGAPVLRGVSLRVRAGDRMLLEGPSGGGKSTLGALLAGLRAPESGLLLLGGLDRRSLGAAAWRRRVAATPQFHENHVLQGTFAFNLLMGRRWPPSPADLAEAEAVCRELGLGELLARMPGGLEQTVGETGWQLSHGERSRLYIARSLLQGAEVLVFDESFGALDPEMLDRALRSVLARAPTLLVIAHP